jgi:hypothetical protein
VRRVIAVESPDAAQRGGAARPRLTQSLDERLVDRVAFERGGLRRVDHELLPEPQAVLVGAGKTLRLGEALTVSLAHPDPLDGQQRTPEKTAKLRQHPGDLVTEADRDDHHRHLGVAREDYDAAAVAREVQASGLPGEFAEKLMLAA